MSNGQFVEHATLNSWIDRDLEQRARIEQLEAKLAKEVTLKRYWINAPSSLQPIHKWHGARVLADKRPESMVTVYFTEGATISARISSLYLADGWGERAPAAKASQGELDPIGYQCDGCGRLCRHPFEDLLVLRESGARSCCPERKMIGISVLIKNAVEQALADKQGQPE